jgi:hypothetical protein
VLELGADPRAVLRIHSPYGSRSAMEYFLNPGIWKSHWACFRALGTIFPLILSAIFGVWWFREGLFEAWLGDLKEQMAALNENLKFAADKSAEFEIAINNIRQEFQIYKENVVVDGSKASPTMVDAAIVAAADVITMMTYLSRVTPIRIGGTKKRR